jgi:membrane protein
MNDPATSTPASARSPRRHLDWPDRRRKPRRISELPPGAWGRIAKRTFDRYRADGVTNLAAALTYRSVLSVFPALIALVALLGVVGQYPETFNAVLRIVGGFAPASTVESVSGPVHQIIAHKGGASALLGVGLAGTVWGASGTWARFRGLRTSSGRPGAGVRGIANGRLTSP